MFGFLSEPANLRKGRLLLRASLAIVLSLLHLHRITTSSVQLPQLQPPHSELSSLPCAQDRMGCSTSSQTSAVDTTRTDDKPEESNGASTTGAANQNGNVAEDSETIPDQTSAEGGDVKPVDEPAAASISANSTAAVPPAGEEHDVAAADSTTETGASSPEPAAPEQENTEATVTEAPAPSE